MKPQIFIKVIFVLVIILASSNVYSTSYYVNDAVKTGDIWCTSAGSLGGSGSTASPYSTLKAALTVAVSGDFIYVDAGDYNEKYLTAKSGVTVIGAGASITKFKSTGISGIWFINFLPNK